MMRRFNRLSLVLAIALGINACKHDPVEPKPFEPQVVGFPEAITSILERDCAIPGCHVSNSAPENLDLTTWEKAFEGSKFGSVLIPYEPDWSHLFQHLNTYADLGTRAEPRMPPQGDALSRQTVLTIRAWIQGGALDSLGLYKWAQEESRHTGKLFSLCSGSDLIAVSDIHQNLVMRFIRVGQLEEVNEAPHYIATSPDGKFIYITLLLGALVEKYRTDTYELVGRVEVGDSPALIEVEPNGNRIIISHWNAGNGTPKLTLLDAETMTILDQVRGNQELLSFGHGMAAKPDFSQLYIVANDGNYYAKYQIGASSLVEIDKIPIDPENAPFAQPTKDYQPYHAILSQDATTLFISCSETNEIRVFDTETDNLLAQIPTGDFPRLMAYSPDTDRLFVACAKEENFTEQGSMRGCVSVIDTRNFTFIQNIYRLGHRPHGISISQEKNLLFVSSENNGDGNEDPPHHFVEGIGGTPGKYNVVDLNTLGLLRDEETEIAVYPNALVVVE